MPGKTLTAFIDALVDKLFFSVITVMDGLNAFKVFETLNARGIRLSTTDLLKNHVFALSCTQATHEQERVHDGIAYQVTHEQLSEPRQILDASKTIYPSDEQFKAAFTERALRTGEHRTRRLVRYILFELERQLSGQDFELESAAYSLAYIRPENPSDDWADIPNTEHNRLVYRSGNLTPLESGLNRRLGNGGYAAKRERYTQSGCALTRALVEHYDTWDAKTVAARQKQMARIAAGIWTFDFGN